MYRRLCLRQGYFFSKPIFQGWQVTKCHYCPMKFSVDSEARKNINANGSDWLGFRSIWWNDEGGR